MYMDTDSYTIAATKDYHDLPRPELREEWDREFPKMFVVDEKNIDQKREPGLLKVEATVTNGGVVCLSSKVSNTLSHLTQ